MTWKVLLDKHISLAARTQELIIEHSGASDTAHMRYYYTVHEQAQLTVFIIVVTQVSKKIDILVHTAGAQAQITCYVIGTIAAAAKVELNFYDHEEHPCGVSRFEQYILLKDHAHLKSASYITLGPGASGTDAQQYSYTLLMGDAHVAQSAPYLEIKRFDVGCKHGAAIGSVHEEAYLYAATRGLTVADIEDLIKKNFFVDTLEKVCKNNSIKEELLNYKEYYDI